MFKQLFYLLFILLLSQNCARKPIGTFQADQAPLAPDYSQEKCWAALPDREDDADAILDADLKDVQTTAKVDVFWLHPTTYTGKKGETNWNASLDNEELNQRTDESSIKYQASIFNGVGKVYAPRYRQIQLQVYGEFGGERNASAVKAGELAYQDVKAAFEYYLDNYNKGRPIIIASHSQGTSHSKKLLKDYFDGKALQQQLVAAYIIGIPVAKTLYEEIPVCQTADETGCFVTWRTFKKGYVPKGYALGDTLAVVNPLTWTTDNTPAPASLNQGTIIDDKNGKYVGVADAQVNTQNGILWLTKPKSPLRLRLFPSKNFHIGDLNLYYVNIRENAKARVKAFLDDE
ncbi:MAG: DUF3089 domain-containing protein [Bacteroidota bacterium]